MRRLTQRLLADPKRNDGHTADGTPGDCYRTCLAILADTSYKQAPHAALYLSWFNEARRFIQMNVPGSDLQCFDWDGSFDLYGDGQHRLVIATGPSPRGDFLHCVIADAVTGEILHDPHPSRAGLTRIETADAITPFGDRRNLPMTAIPALVGGKP